MNCNCVKRVEEKLSSHPAIIAKAGEHAKATCMATALQMTDDMGIRSVVNIPFRIVGTRKGFTTLKGKEMPVVASYCPFCGRTTSERYKVGEYDGLVPMDGSEVLA